MTIPNAAERLASEKYQSYMRGWRDGATGKAKRKEFMEHPTRQDLAHAYGWGYGMGETAAGKASSFAQGNFGYTPSILRKASVESPDERWLASHYEFGFQCSVQGWDAPPVSFRDDDVTRARKAGFEYARQTATAYDQLAQEQAAEWVAGYLATKPEVP